MRLSSKGNGISVLIESTMSSGESHGLYDYEKKTKFNQTLSIDDTRCSYVVFIKNETGQLIVQPEFNEGAEIHGDLGQDFAQDVRFGSVGVSTSKVPDISKEFVPILRLYLSKNSWFVEIIRDINRQLRTSSVHSTQSQSVPGCSVDLCFRSLSKTNSGKGRSQYKEDNKVWLVAPKTSPGIPLVKGDLLKFGRCKMVIHDIITTSSVAREESSKVPFLPLLGLQDLRTDSSEPNLLAEESPAEPGGESEALDFSASYLMDRVIGSYSKGDAKFADDFTGNFLIDGCEDVASRLMLSNSISNDATCENLNLHSFRSQQSDQLAASAKKGSSPVVSPRAEAQTQYGQRIVASCRTQKTKVSRCCRICLSDDGDGFADSNESPNPLICPCDCKGSMQYVHLQCLRTWLESRLEIPSGWLLHTGRDSISGESSPPPGQSPRQTPGAGSPSQMQLRDRVRSKVISLFRRWASRLSGPSYKVSSPACLHLRKFECELCKVYFPTQLRLIDYDGSGPGFVPLYRVPRPRFPYLVLVPLEGDFSSKIGQIVVSFGGASTPVCIGRGHSSDIRLGEISVSRSHAQLQHCYSSGSYQICLLDLKSKFGSLIEFTRPIKLGKENLSIQVGRTLVSLKTFRPNGSASNVMSLFSGCIGRSMTISGIQEANSKSQRTKSVNLTFDSSSELLGFGDSELVNSLRNASDLTSSCPEDPHRLGGDNKQLHRFRDASGNVVPRRHSYIFDP